MSAGGTGSPDHRPHPAWRWDRRPGASDVVPAHPGKAELQGLDPEDPAGRPADEDDPDTGEDPEAVVPDLVEDHVGHRGQEGARDGADAPDDDEEHEDDAGEEVEVGGARPSAARSRRGRRPARPWPRRWRRPPPW